MTREWGYTHTWGGPLLHVDVLTSRLEPWPVHTFPARRSPLEFVCLFDSCISIPLHGAQRAMAAALPLPPAGQRRHFRGISARPGPACVVIVGLPPSAQKQKRKAKEKAHDAPRRKQKKTNCRPPRPPTPPSPPGRLPTPFQPPRCPSNTAVSGGRKISY